MVFFPMVSAAFCETLRIIEIQRAESFGSEQRFCSMFYQTRQNAGYLC